MSVEFIATPERLRLPHLDREIVVDYWQSAINPCVRVPMWAARFDESVQIRLETETVNDVEVEVTNEYLIRRYITRFHAAIYNAQLEASGQNANQHIPRIEDTEYTDLPANKRRYWMVQRIRHLDEYGRQSYMEFICELKKQ